VKEVIKRLNELENKADTEIETKSVKKRTIVTVFTGSDIELNTLTEQIKVLAQNYNIKVIFTKAARKILDRETLRQRLNFEEIEDDVMYKELSKAEAVIFPNLTQNTAAKVAAGIRDSIGSEAMATALLMGKVIVAACDSIPVKGIPGPYGEMCSEILNKLSRFGVKFCKVKEIANKVSNILREKNAADNESNESKESVESKLIKSIVEENDLIQERNKSVCEISVKDVKLITNEFINRIAAEGHSRIFIPKFSIVTPLARDTARDKKIEIISDGELNENM
jgi:flavoprotein